MTSIERTAYPRFTHAPSTKELREFSTPTPEDETFVTTMARGASPQLSLMVVLKVFQRMWRHHQDTPKNSNYSGRVDTTCCDLERRIHNIELSFVKKFLLFSL